MSSKERVTWRPSAFASFFKLHRAGLGGLTMRSQSSNEKSAMAGHTDVVLGGIDVSAR